LQLHPSGSIAVQHFSSWSLKTTRLSTVGKRGGELALRPDGDYLTAAEARIGAGRDRVHGFPRRLHGVVPGE
jgi:hypothetical protein